jgi:O-antigen ligase
MFLIHISGVVSLFLAPWLVHDPDGKKKDWALILIIAGFLGNIFLNFHPDKLDNIYRLQREFRMNPNTFGMLAGVMILGMLTVGLRWLDKLRDVQRWWLRFPAYAIWMLVLLILLASLVISESRGGWITFVLVALVAFGIMLWKRRELRRRNRREIAACLAILAVVTVILCYWLGPRITHQFTDERDMQAIEKLTDFQFKDLPMGSAGQRIRMWEFGLHHIADRPIFGWGPGSIGYRLDQEAPKARWNQGYLHNTPLQFLMQIGALGTGMFIAWMVLAVRAILLSYRYNTSQFEWLVFPLGTVAFYFIFGSADSPFHFDQYRFVLVFLGAIAMASQLQRIKSLVEPLPSRHS